MCKQNAAMLAVLVTSVNAFGLQLQQAPSMSLAEGPDSSLTLSAGMMLQSGEARELVFDGNHKLSELIWDISGLALAGGTLSATFGPRLRLNASLWIGVTQGSGSMVDYDWFIEGAEWTHFSDGDVKINSAMIADFNAAYTFYQRSGLECYGVLGYKRLFWDWSEYGRTYIYSDYGFRDSRGSIGGVNGIDYEQQFDVPYIGIGARRPFGRVCGSAYVLYSPFVQAVDKDHHILRDLYFKETFKSIDYFAVGGDLTATLTDSLFVTFAVEMHSIPEARGDLEGREVGGASFFENNAAGIENTAFSMMLTAGVHL